MASEKDIELAIEAANGVGYLPSAHDAIKMSLLGEFPPDQAVAIANVREDSASGIDPESIKKVNAALRRDQESQPQQP